MDAHFNGLPGCHTLCVSRKGREQADSETCSHAQKKYNAGMIDALTPKAAISLFIGLLACTASVLGEQYPGDIASGARSMLIAPPHPCEPQQAGCAGLSTASH